MKIYILKGSTGMYEDSYEWVVRAYTSDEKAKEACEKANEEAEEFIKRATTEQVGDYYEEVEEQIASEVFTVDPAAIYYYDGRFCYYLVETELVTSEEAT